MKKLTNKFIIIYDYNLHKIYELYPHDYPQNKHLQTTRTVTGHPRIGLNYGQIIVFGHNLNIIPCKRFSKFVKYINLTKSQLIDIVLAEYKISSLIPNIIDNKTGVWKDRHFVSYKDMIRTLRETNDSKIFNSFRK